MAQKFIGNTSLCFQDFLKRASFAVLREFAKFCNASDIGVVEKWATEAIVFPGGEQLLRIRCFLQLAGYEVEEINALPEYARRVALVVGCGLVSGEDAAVKIGYKKEKVDNLWSIIVRQQSMRGKEQALQEAAAHFWAKHETAVNAQRSKIAKLTQKPVEKLVTPPVPTLQTSLELLAALDRAVAMVVALAQLVVKDKRGASSFAQLYPAALRELRAVLAKLPN